MSIPKYKVTYKELAGQSDEVIEGELTFNSEWMQFATGSGLVALIRQDGVLRVDRVD